MIPVTVDISKMDAARRQLLAGVHIHWYLDEPLAVYSLAANSWELVDALLSTTNKLRMIDIFAIEHGRPAREFRDMLNGPRNFIKHADRDPHAVLPDITEEDCDSALMFACVDYMMASGRTPYIIQMFVAWYAAINPTKTGAFFRQEAEITFPNVVGLPRKDQKAVARSVAREWGKSEIMAHPTNELTDNSRWTKLRDALR